jgi:type II secretory pathway component PulM
MTLSPRDRRALLLGAGVLAAICLVRFVIVPFWEGWGQARQEASDCRSQIADLEKRALRLANMQEMAESVYGPSAAKALRGTEAGRIAFTKAVQDALRAGGIKFESLTPRPDRAAERASDVRFVPLQVRGKCSLPQLAKCLAGMRKAAMPIIVDQIRVTSDPKKPGNLDLTMVVSTLAKRDRRRS